MPRAIFAGLTIVAAFHLLAVAPSRAEDAPLSAPVVELADRLNVDPRLAPTRFLPEMARLLYGLDSPRAPLLVVPRLAPSNGEPIVTVPVPLTTEIWSRAIFRHTVPSSQLVAWILQDRRAALLCRGLSGLDDETLEFLSQRPQLLRALYERGAELFGAFGHNVRVRGGRLVPPGGSEASPLWASVLTPATGRDRNRDQPLAAERAIRTLFFDQQARLPYLYDVISAATPAGARFALGLWIEDPVVRGARFNALVATVGMSYREWRTLEHPFLRPLGDLSVMLLRLPFEASGAPRAPASRRFWAEVIPADPNRTFTGRDAIPGDVIDAAWLVSATGEANAYQRIDLVDQMSFGVRLLAGTPEPGADQTLIVRAFRDRRMLLLTLERMGVSAPATYLAAIERAVALDDVSGDQRFWLLTQYQGALALVARMRQNGALDARGADALVRSLSAVPIQDGGYRGGVARWIRRDWAAQLLPAADWEARVIASIAGVSGLPGAPRLVFEGQRYRLDLAYAERQRLEIVRRKQGGHTVDLAFALQAVIDRLLGEAGGAPEIRAAAARLREIAKESAPRLKLPGLVVMPPGVDAPRDGLEWTTDAANELDRAARTGDWRHAVRVGHALQDLADMVLGDALLSLTYAAHLGDPDGPALLAGNVAFRHDLGMARRASSESRARVAWAMPRQEFQPGVPWHVTGSLLGLDLALAQMSLHRLAVDRFGVAPSLPSIEREALPAAVTLIDSQRLRDRDLGTIADAVARGRARVAAIADKESAEAVADTLQLDGYRRRRLHWSVRYALSSIPAQFSLAEVMALGGGAQGADLEAWGPPAVYGNGCICTWFPPVTAWRALQGRYQLPMVAATMGDLTLAVALQLHDMQLPAALARSVLSIAMQDFFDEQSSAYGGDWLSYAQQAQSLRSQNVQDYVSAAAAVNGPLVPDTSDASQEH